MKTPTLVLTAILTLLSASARAQFCSLGETVRHIVICKPSISMAECRDEAQKVGCSVVREVPLIHAVVVRVPATRMFALTAKLRTAPKVERIDEDRKVRWVRNLPSFDPASPDLSDLTKKLKQLPALPAAAKGPQIPWGVQRVGAPLAWARTQGDGAAVAVIDTGIDATHPDLAGQVVGGVNVTDPARPDAWADDEGHGTHVAGTIAGKGLNGGLAGVAPRAKLYAVKVLDKDGNGNYSDVIAGIQWAMDHGIKIANMSLGADEGSEPLHRAVQAALAKGLLIVAAAGNTGGSVGYPGAYPETVAVAAADSSDHVAPFSSRGPEVTYIAPGVDILSTKMGGGSLTLSGTSMASPHVAGMAALAYAAGVRGPAALRSVLDRSSRPIAGLTPDLEGHGMPIGSDMLAGLPHRTDGIGGGPTLAMASAR
ncbi:MAG: S8 family peptidase [Elusimicrobia bacterium]|nr:S8 family peptidase [Elusimicrobiota bacterium]